MVNYSLHGCTLSATSKHTYLAVMLDDHLSWSIYVTNVANKATRMRNFLKCHLSKCSSNVKVSAYLLMVRPLMEYTCVVWDPHYQSQVSVLHCKNRSMIFIANCHWNHTKFNFGMIPVAIWYEHHTSVFAVWKRFKDVLRWVLSDYINHSSVSSMLKQLNWLPLAKRRKQQRLNLFYQIMNGEIGLSLPDCYHFTNKHTRQYHPFYLIIPHYQLYDKLLSQNHLGMEFTATTTDQSEQSSCVFEPTHRTFVIV